MKIIDFRDYHPIANLKSSVLAAEFELVSFVVCSNLKVEKFQGKV
jgi:hypothetical protein